MPQPLRVIIAAPMSPVDDEITRLLDGYSGVSGDARNRLVERVYDELKAIARGRLAGLPRDGSLETTVLVHEAYLELFGRGSIKWENRAHFFGIVAQAMHDLVVDHLRRRATLKRGGNLERVDVDDSEMTLATNPPADEVLAVAAVLDRLAAVSELSAEVVKLRFFAGLSHDETASALGISRARARREWAYAKAFLYRELKPRIS